MAAAASRTHRAGSSGGIGADGKLSAQEPLDALSALEDEDQVGSLNADLPAHAAARDRDKRGTPPTAFFIPDDHHSMPVPNAHHKAAFDHLRDYHDALGVR